MVFACARSFGSARQRQRRKPELGRAPQYLSAFLCSPEILIRFASTSAFSVSRVVARKIINFFSYLHLFISLVKFLLDCTNHYYIGVAEEAILIGRCSIPLGPQARTCSNTSHEQYPSNWIELPPDGQCPSCATSTNFLNATATTHAACQ